MNVSDGIELITVSPVGKEGGVYSVSSMECEINEDIGVSDDTELCEDTDSEELEGPVSLGEVTDSELLRDSLDETVGPELLTDDELLKVDDSIGADVSDDIEAELSVEISLLGDSTDREDDSATLVDGNEDSIETVEWLEDGLEIDGVVDSSTLLEVEVVSIDDASDDLDSVDAGVG